MKEKKGYFIWVGSFVLLILIAFFITLGLYFSHENAYLSSPDDYHQFELMVRCRFAMVIITSAVVYLLFPFYHSLYFYIRKKKNYVKKEPFLLLVLYFISLPLSVTVLFAYLDQDIPIITNILWFVVTPLVFSGITYFGSKRIGG